MTGLKLLATDKLKLIWQTKVW